MSCIGVLSWGAMCMRTTVIISFSNSIPPNSGDVALVGICAELGAALDVNQTMLMKIATLRQR